MNDSLPTKKPGATDVGAFLEKLRATPKRTPGGGRLLFAMDATASRRPTWDTASQLQAEMFDATRDLGGLNVQVAFFRGFGEFRASPWLNDAARVVRLMTSVSCLAGETQLAKVLSHAAVETRRQRISALVFIGDSLEEDIDAIGNLAGQLGALGVPAFMFHEGNDPVAAFGFGQVAKLSGGAYCRFDASSADTLRQLLGAVAVFAAGGRRALADLAENRGGEVKLLAGQIKAAGGRR